MGTKQKPTGRTQKGCVSVENHETRIRLRWRHQGKRYCLSLGFPYTRAALKVARQLASRIELDMLSGHFDQTLVQVLFQHYAAAIKAPQLPDILT